MRGPLLAATAVVSVVSVVLLAGCGGAVDTAKVTFQRTTVPAGQGGGGNGSGATSGEPRSNDPAFAAAKLRTIDPCGLLTDDILANVGEPVDNDRGDYAECRNYMTDSAGDDLSIGVTLGDNVANAEKATGNIGGLPALENELDSGEACFSTVVTSTSPNFGITVQAGGDGDDLCQAARTVLTGVVELIRTDPPSYETPRGTLIALDPCEVAKDAAVGEALGGAADAGAPYNLHWCNWRGSGGNLGIWLRLGYDPSASGSAGDPVDLGGGVTGYEQSTRSTAASCELQWVHRQFTGEDVEIVHVFLDKRDAAVGEDPCAAARALAKTLIQGLPKP